MGQIIGGAAKPKRCNLNKLSQLGTPAAGEYILVSSDNSMNAAGQGNFDCYIVGDGTTAATALELKNIDDKVLKRIKEVKTFYLPDDSSYVNGNVVYIHSIFLYVNNADAQHAYKVVSINTTFTIGSLFFLVYKTSTDTIRVSQQDNLTWDDEILLLWKSGVGYRPVGKLYDWVCQKIQNASGNATISCDLIAGALWGTTGRIYGTYNGGVSALKSFFVTPNYLEVYPSENISVSVDSGDVFKLFQYGNDFSLVKSSNYLNSDASITTETNTRYIKVVVKKSDGSAYAYSEKRLTITLSKGFKGWVKNERESSSLIFHNYEIAKPVNDDNVVNPSDANYIGNNGTRIANRGYICLPPNYEPNGEPVPVIIHCHGTSGYTYNSDSLPYNSTYVEFLAKCGYAVIGCSTASELYASQSVDGDLVHNLGYCCIKSLYDYMMKMYNLKDDGCYIFGYSSGGMYTIMLSQLKQIPIKAAASMAGSVDMFCNMRICINSLNQRWFTLLGMTDITLPSGSGLSADGTAMHVVDSNVKAYILSHIDNFVGFNPFWLGNNNFDKASFYDEYFDIVNTTANINTDVTLKNITDKASIHLNAPIKFWQAVDDYNVPIGMAKLYQKMVQNGGGICDIRELPAGCGGHHAPGYDGDDSLTPKTNYTTPSGEEVNIAVAYAEMVDWFRRW